MYNPTIYNALPLQPPIKFEQKPFDPHHAFSHFCLVQRGKRRFVDSSVLPIPHLVRAACCARHIQAPRANLPASHTDIYPTPIGATATATKYVDIRRTALNRTLHIIKNKIRDRDAISWFTGSAVIVLANNNAVISDAAESDIRVGHASYAAAVARDGLDADAVLGGFDYRVGKGDRGNGVVAASSDGTWVAVSLVIRLWASRAHR
jgi:hypothetical protein